MKRMSKEHMKEYASYSPAQLKKHMKQEDELLKEKKMKKQGYSAKEDESLGMRRGKESKKKQSYKSRRKESRGMKKGMRGK